MSKSEIRDLGVLGILAMPHGAVALLIITVAVALLVAGFGIGIYLILNGLHLLTGITFMTCALAVLYLGVKSRVITEDTLKKYQWLPLTPFAAFLVGYIIEVFRLPGLSALTVAPLNLSTAEQMTANTVVLVILVPIACYIAFNLLKHYKIVK